MRRRRRQAQESSVELLDVSRPDDTEDRPEQAGTSQRALASRWGPILAGTIALVVVAAGVISLLGRSQELSVEEYEADRAIERANATLTADLAPIGDIVGYRPGPLLGRETGLYVYTSGPLGGQRIDLDTGAIAPIKGLTENILTSTDRWLVLGANGVGGSGHISRVPLSDPKADPEPFGLDGGEMFLDEGAQPRVDRGTMIQSGWREDGGPVWAEFTIDTGALIDHHEELWWSQGRHPGLVTTPDGQVFSRRDGEFEMILSGWSVLLSLDDGSFLARRCPEDPDDCEHAWFDASGASIDRPLSAALNELMTETAWVEAIGPLIVSFEDDNGPPTLSTVIDAFSGETVEAEFGSEPGPGSVAQSPDGRYVAFTDTSVVTILDRQTGERTELPRLDRVGARSLAFVAKEDVVANLVESLDTSQAPAERIRVEELRAFDDVVEVPRTRPDLPPSNYKPIDSVETRAFVDTLTTDLLIGGGSSELTRIELESGTTTTIPMPSTVAGIYPLAGGDHVAVSLDDGRLFVVDLAVGDEPIEVDLAAFWIQSVTPAQLPGQINVVAAVEAQNGSTESIIALVDLDDGSIITQRRQFFRAGSAGSAWSSNDGTVFAIKGDDHVPILSGWAVVASTLDHVLATRCPTSPDDCEIAWFDLNGQPLDRPLPQNLSTNAPVMWGTWLDPSGRVLVTPNISFVDEEHTMQIFDIKRNRVVGHANDARFPSVSVSNDGRLLVLTAFDDSPEGLGSVYIMDLDSEITYLVAENVVTANDHAINVVARSQG